MYKNILKMMIIIGIFTVLTGCNSVKNRENEKKTIINQTAQEKTIINQTTQEKVNEVKNSSIPNFQEMFNETIEMEININSYSDGTYKAIKIKDIKMVSDILMMIGKSQLITDESKIKNMSGMASKNNKLILIKRNGTKTEISFAFDDPAFAVGYLEINKNKYDPGFSFFRYMKDFTEYSQFDTNVDNQVEELFKKYDWTIDYKINTIKETLPSNLKHEAGEYPVKIYWAYNSELSKSIGMDYKPYLGKKVDIEIYRLREPLPDYMNPRMNARGIVLKYDGKIIGAYIDAGRHDCFACSLDRKTLKDITNMEWDNWISDYINYNNELEIKLSKMTPEDVIKQYYDAMNNHDTKMEFACMTRQNICKYLAMNMDNNLLINEGFNDIYLDGSSNVKSAKVIDLREISSTYNPKGTMEYAVTIDFKFKKEITSSNGKQPRFIILKKESGKSGWRIQSEGTGP